MEPIGAVLGVVIGFASVVGLVILFIVKKSPRS